MTLAGTRPILQDELLKYELHHRARIAIKPGITGIYFLIALLLQVKGEAHDLLRHPQYFINQRFCHQFTPPQGESFYDFLQRVDGFINNEFLPYKNRNVQENFIICAHNQILKLLYCRLQNVSIEENWMSLDFPSGTVVKIYP